MRTIVTIALLAASAAAYAEGTPTPPKDPAPITIAPVAQAGAAAGAIAGAEATAISGAAAGAISGSASSADGGDAQAEGGSAILNYENRQRRQVPAIGLAASNSTAECVIAFGAGGAGTGGSGLITIGLVQSDCLRMAYFGQIAEAGQTLKAAELVCAGMRNKLRSWLGGKPNCIAVMRDVADARHDAAVAALFSPMATTPAQPDPWPLLERERQICDERLERCERTVEGKR